MYPGDNAIAISASLAIYLIAFVNSVVSIGGHSSDYIAILLLSKTSREGCKSRDLNFKEFSKFIGTFLLKHFAHRLPPSQKF